MTLHYERCHKYYGSGNSLGAASETEKRLSMLLFYAIFDSLSFTPYNPELFEKALPCMTAIGSSISPDYALTSDRAEAELARVGPVGIGLRFACLLGGTNCRPFRPRSTRASGSQGLWMTQGLD